MMRIERVMHKVEWIDDTLTRIFLPFDCGVGRKFLGGPRDLISFTIRKSFRDLNYLAHDEVHVIKGNTVNFRYEATVQDIEDANPEVLVNRLFQSFMNDWFGMMSRKYSPTNSDQQSLVAEVHRIEVLFWGKPDENHPAIERFVSKEVEPHIVGK